MKKFNEIFIFLRFFFLEKKIFLINSPSEYLCLIEWSYKEKIDKDKIKVVIGFTTEVAINQIKDLSIKYCNFNKLFFLKDLFNEYIFRFILNIYKVFHVRKELVVVGDYKYYLNQPIYNKAKKFILLDEGISLTRLEKAKIKNSNFQMFSIFNHFNKSESISNKFDYLKSFMPQKKIDNGKIILLGTRAVEMNLITKNFYYQKIVKFCELYNKKNILFYPHRSDNIFDNYKPPKNLTIQETNLPIEAKLLYLDMLPEKIVGFYSMALLNLSIILESTGVEIMNIAYDTSDYKNEDIKKSFKIITKLTQFKNIQQIKI